MERRRRADQKSAAAARRYQKSVSTSNGSVASVVQADKATSIPLTLMARSRAGSKMEVSSVVLAAEAK